MGNLLWQAPEAVDMPGCVYALHNAVDIVTAANYLQQ